MCDPLTKPENRVRTCNDHPCPPRWNYTEFSQCTKSCGIGIQTREVSCIHEVTRGGTNTVVVPNSMCPQPPPPDRQYCNVLDCPVRWHTGEWSKCSKTCGGGIKQREVECKQVMAQSHVVERPISSCNSPRPAPTKPCNTRPCLLDTASPEISLDNSSYIQHDPKKKKVTVKIGGSATVFYGTQVKIKCPVKGYNRTKIQWAKDHQIISKSKKYKISKKTTKNSRGQRMVDPLIVYQNYGTPIKTHVINLEDKQIVFPEDDDSDIIIVNEDYSKNGIEEERVQNLKDTDDVEVTTEMRPTEAVDAKEYAWMTTEWSPCSAPCGQIGHQIRGAICQHKKHNSTTTVETDECLSRGLTPPGVLLPCAGGACANWRAAPSLITLSSFPAIMRRRVECVSDNGTILAPSSCDPATQPEKTRREPEPCRAAWAVGPWSKCIGRCHSTGRQHRVLRCVWRSTQKRRKERSAGAACEGLRRPVVLRQCTVTCDKQRDGVCRDSSRFCENVRAMNFCALQRYKTQCCKTCYD
ncbi:hypothetical protein MSG28_012849 [Choristoneura fumiferana]|uniref:Uncharacterized protein n=1 Tax=Choristoneura fumiferana TaxID=7141 RepID=A0ACC0JID2_CHOFU|nr:hypothetical protein MSG28_012849 [Choristoneura fumiferana]